VFIGNADAHGLEGLFRAGKALSGCEPPRHSWEQASSPGHSRHGPIPGAHQFNDVPELHRRAPARQARWKSGGTVNLGRPAALAA